MIIGRLLCVMMVLLITQKKVAQRYVAEYSDKFILLENDKNMGLNYTLNKCLKFAKGEYIARMDGDDTCSEERFQKEIECLINNPDIDIVSTDMTFLMKMEYGEERMLGKNQKR